MGHAQNLPAGFLKKKKSSEKLQIHSFSQRKLTIKPTDFFFLSVDFNAYQKKCDFQMFSNNV